MIDVQFHLKGEQTDQRRLRTVPVAGSYIFGPGAKRRLWQVSAVVFDGPTIHAYCVQASPRLTAALTRAWATWGEAADLG